MLTGIRAGFAETQPAPGTKKKMKHSKRGKKGGNAASMSQPPLVTRVNDSLPVCDAPVLHIAGRPMLPANALKGLTPEIRRLHDHVLSMELNLLRAPTGTAGYPLYAAKVPSGLDFNHISPADLIFLRFYYIFEMLHMRRVDFTFVRLYALHLNYLVKKEELSQIAVADPYYMSESFLNLGDEECKGVEKYITKFMLDNKDKEIILVPYHPM